MAGESVGDFISSVKASRRRVGSCPCPCTAAPRARPENPAELLCHAALEAIHKIAAERGLVVDQVVLGIKIQRQGTGPNLGVVFSADEPTDALGLLQYMYRHSLAPLQAFDRSGN